MSQPPEAGPAGPTGDVARVSVRVAAPPARAFRLFTEEIGAWWRAGMRFRALPESVMRLEAGVGGRLLEELDGPGGPRLHELGQVRAWEPPGRLVLSWRNTNFAPDEETTVEVLFQAAGRGTLVTVAHSGWSRLRVDHPARHGLEAAPFVRMMGLFWADLLTALREHADRAKLEE